MGASIVDDGNTYSCHCQVSEIEALASVLSELRPLAADTVRAAFAARTAVASGVHARLWRKRKNTLKKLVDNCFSRDLL
jgi:hypothetical protein